MPPPRAYRAGETVEDYCRACKIDRHHTVIVVDGSGRPIRVTCEYCRSEHNFRGGPRMSSGDSAASSPAAIPAKSPAPRQPRPDGEPFALVSDRERTAPAMSPTPNGSEDLELLLRRIIREESGLSPVVPAAKWRGGTMALKPGTPGLQEKTWPIETFFHKVVMLRNRLRTLEQQLNASALPEDVKVKLQAYVSGCYGSLTSFNVLFADADDRFRGSGGED